jgi:hypothetical protein
MQFERATTRTDRNVFGGSEITVNVVYTDESHTLVALEHAASLGRSLHASVRVLAPLVVPFPRQLSDPPVDSRVLSRRLATAAEGLDLPSLIETIWCRDRNEAVWSSLAPRSIVVICWRRRWFFDATERLATRLAALGHHVIALR